ncbi:formate dehydrogenase beta subunit [Crenobacter caeni]|uniref:formate dehydrogenase beta subunit n=1 Tax=Crenobacter caeni TaxID=2705474 RepID=UPI0032C438E8
MSVRVRISEDSVACALGADDVARALAAALAVRGLTADIVRVSARGLYWLEPLLEVDTDAGSFGYGPVTDADIDSLLDAGLLQGGAHPLALGPVDALPFLARQQRLVFARAGLIRPLSLDDYLESGGYAGLKRVLETGEDAFIAELEASGLRGRGGAAFPAHIKWQGVRAQGDTERFVVCNADEGDSGAYADRMLMEGDPYALLEGMTIAALCVGAEQGYVYVRSEYPHAIEKLKQAVAHAEAAGFLGEDIAGSGRAFRVEVRAGAGAYICGEESALIESIEGKRGQVRARPPLPAVCGLFGKPTLVHNVLSLASLPVIARDGGAAFYHFGRERSRGTLALTLAGCLRRCGLIETAFGPTLGELVDDFGGGAKMGRVKAVQVGGPLGAWLTVDDFDLPLDYEAFAARGAILGHGSVVAVDEACDMAGMARLAFTFCAAESCGKCTPCRVGSVRGGEIVERLMAGSHHAADDVALLLELTDTLRDASLCALGGMLHYPVRSAIEHFPDEFTGRDTR